MNLKCFLISLIQIFFSKNNHASSIPKRNIAYLTKLRANHDWGINWGGSENDLVQDGSNLNIEAGTYKFQLYISYAGNNKVVITKQ